MSATRSLPGASLQRELALFAEAGIGIEQVWKLATRDAGQRLGIKGLGCVEAGAPADILVFRRDPTRNLDHRASLEAVVAAGRLYRSARPCEGAAIEHGLFQLTPDQAAGAPWRRTGTGAGVRNCQELRLVSATSV
jgi:predicted amidohydrolase